jgi:hypothetical protein
MTAAIARGREDAMKAVGEGGKRGESTIINHRKVRSSNRWSEDGSEREGAWLEGCQKRNKGRKR